MSQLISVALIYLTLFHTPQESKPRAVSITSKDGFVLKGHFYSANNAGPGILLLHQCNRRGPLTGYENLAASLANAGFHVLMLDSRGFGASVNAQYRNFHAQMDLIEQHVPDDVEAAYRFLTAQSGLDKQKIGVVGASCGTSLAMQLAKRHAEIRALVFLSGSYLGMAEIEADYEALTHLPVLCIYSEEDRYCTPESMRAAFTNSKNKDSKIVAYKGNLHGAPLFAHDKNLEDEIVKWFAAQLKL